MEITPQVYSLPAQPAFYTGPQSPNVFLVVDGDEGALIDSGFGDEKSVKERLEMLRAWPGLRLLYIVLTHHHFDHTSGAAQMREATGARTALHEREEEFLRDWRGEAPQDIELPGDQGQLGEALRRFRRQAAEAGPDIRVADGDRLRVGSLTLEIIHTPGHTMGSVCVYLPEERALFTGDTALGLGTVAISPPPHGDMALYLESLERLKGYDAVMMLPGHGQSVRDVPHKLQELIDHRREREDQILRLLTDGKRKPEVMLRVIYPELDKRIVPMAVRQIEAHLAKLESEGRVSRLGEGEWVLA